MIDVNTLRFRASSAGQLLIGAPKITPNQRAKISTLKEKLSNGITDSQLIELGGLLDKKKQVDKPKLGKGAISYVRSLVLRHEYGYDEPIYTKEMIKGLECEPLAIALVNKVFPVEGVFRIKNKESFREDEYFTGTPDLITLSIPDVVEEIKNCWTMKQFFDKKEQERISKLYYTQGQVYMYLTGRKKFVIYFCMVSTPDHLIMEEEKSYYFKFGCDEENEDYIDACKKIRAMHEVDHIEPSKRVVKFEYEYDEDYIDTLKKFVHLGRKEYEKLAY